jgi:hypothetical protein
MNFVTYITTILLGFQPIYGDNESWDQRVERMTIIAQAIDEASSKSTCSDKYNVPGCTPDWPADKKSLALLLVTTGYWESKFAKNVHEGKCKTYECDAYRVNGNVRHRARSLWQIQKTPLVTMQEYSKMNSSSLESTTMSAIVATRHLSLGMKRCNTLVGAMSMYATSSTCGWRGAKIRNSFYEKINEKSEEQILQDAEKQKQQQLLKVNKKK